MSNSHKFLITLTIAALIILLAVGFYLDTNNLLSQDKDVVWSSKELRTEYENGRPYLEFTGCFQMPPPYTMTLPITLSKLKPIICVSTETRP